MSYEKEKKLKAQEQIIFDQKWPLTKFTLKVIKITVKEPNDLCNVIVVLQDSGQIIPLTSQAFD